MSPRRGVCRGTASRRQTPDRTAHHRLRGFGVAWPEVWLRASRVGRLLAAFFVAMFPGNVAQFTHKRDGFGLNTDTRRFVRLLFQPVLVAWAVGSTGVPRRS